MTKEVQIGQIINDQFIEDVYEMVHEMGTQEHMHSEEFCRWYSADGDKTGDFYASLKATTDITNEIWERDHEYKDVTSKIEEMIRYRLEEEQLYRECQDVSTTEWEHHPAFYPVIITAENIERVKQCLRDAANDITWAISESVQLFLQTLNPCCWDDKPPQERYGKDWVEDPETRVILIEDEYKQYGLPSDTVNRCIEKGHTLSRHGDYISEYNTEGEEVIGAYDG